MQRLDLGSDEKSVRRDDKPFQISTTRSEKNEDLVEQWNLGNDDMFSVAV